MSSNPSDPAVELVFVYGMFRKNASNYSRLKGAKRIGEATIRGRLLKIGWFPALVIDPQAKTLVWGDLFEMKGEQLQAFHCEYEGLAAGAREGQDCRVVHARVQQVPASLGSLKVRLWEWTGDAGGAELIATGDWLDVECPKSPPFFTLIAGVCALASPVAIVTSNSTYDDFLEVFFLIVVVAAPVAGWIALHWASRRRERAELLQFVVVVVLAFMSIAAGLFFLKGVVMWARELFLL